MKYSQSLTALISILAISKPAVLALELDVDTSSGPVQGFYNNSAQTVRAFLGIPYAEPPVAERRFAPPARKARSNEVYNAVSFGPTCPGDYAYNNESIWYVLPYSPWDMDNQSEDCLSINIWAPAERHPGRNKNAAVMMYIYGGAFAHGSTAIAFYDGANLVNDNEGVIVVTFNYRLSVFGYPNSPDIPVGEQNVGLLDQRLAIEWVHHNIASFGGDPSRIMLFGQSAGGVSTDTYSYAAVNAIGIQSGAAFMRGLLGTGTDHRDWNSLSTAVGCSSGKGTIGCMQTVPLRRILVKVTSEPYRFAPILDNVTIFSDYVERARKGQLSRLPTLIGRTECEAAAGFNLSSPSINETEQYILTQTAYNCPIHQSTVLRVEQNIPTWRYLYRGNWSNLSPVPWLGAYHSSDIPIVLGTYNNSPLGISSRAQVEASRYIQGAWVAFAKEPLNGLRDYGWPRFNAHGKTLVNLALNNSVPAVFTSASEWDRSCHGSQFVL